MTFISQLIFILLLGWHFQGFFRYWTPTIKKLLGELSQAESEKESMLKNILQRLIGRFCEHHNKWRQLVSATAGMHTLPSLFQIHSSICAHKCDCLYRRVEYVMQFMVLFLGNNGISSDHDRLVPASIVSQNLTLCLGNYFLLLSYLTYIVRFHVFMP